MSLLPCLCVFDRFQPETNFYASLCFSERLHFSAFVLRLLYLHENLQHIVEGEKDVLVRNGHIRKNRHKQEMITIEELREAAHKQGVSRLSEVDRAVLDPNGVISFIAKEPAAEILRHKEVMQKLELEIEMLKYST